MPVLAFDAINDALEICSGLGFEMVPGFSTHWPMGAETLIRLGRPDLVHQWATLYPTKRKHLPLPDPVAAIEDDNESNWRSALGNFARAGDWRRYFERRLLEAPWREVLTHWWPRLIPGMASGLTHGLIRTMHAVRSLNLTKMEPSPLQLREVASGLGYWASLYVEQPGPHALLGDARFPDIIASIPRLESHVKIGTREKGLFRHMPGVEGWGRMVSKLATPVDLQTALSDMTLAFVQVNLVHDKEFPIPLIHTVTAPAAVRVMLEHLPEELHIPTYLAVWEATAAILTNFAPPNSGETSVTQPADDAEVLIPSELAERAVAHGDEHAMKFAEACIREYRLRPDRRYLLAATRMIPKLLRYFR